MDTDNNRHTFIHTDSGSQDGGIHPESIYIGSYREIVIAIESEAGDSLT